MADEGLRALERRAAGGDPRAAFELARGLLRAGDAERALEWAWKACEDVGLRREVARLGLRGRPVRRAPRVAWQTRLEGRGLERLEASPLGVLVNGTIVVDSATGALRGQLPSAASGWQDEVLFSARQGKRNLSVAAFDPWTLERLFDATLEGQLAGHGSGRYALRRGDELVVLGDEARRPPEERWRWAAPGGNASALFHEEVVALFHRRATPDTRLRVELFQASGRSLAILDGIRPVALDAEGLVGLEQVEGPGRASSPAAFDLAGAPRWRLGSEGQGLRPIEGRLLGELHGPRTGRDLVFARVVPEGFEVHRLDRTTGATLGVIRLSRLPAPIDDVLFETATPDMSHVSAMGWDGAPLWSWSATKTRVRRAELPLAFLPDRVFVLLAGRELVCLVEGSSAPKA